MRLNHCQDSNAAYEVDRSNSHAYGKPFSSLWDVKIDSQQTIRSSSV